MSRGRWSSGSVVLVGLVFVLVGLLNAGEKQPPPPEVIMIENAGYKRDKKGPVKFSHKKHQDEYVTVEGKKIQCTECHHHYEEGKNVWKEGDPVKKCGTEGCHSPLKTVKKGKTKILKLNLALHRNCKTCHKEIKKKGKLPKDAKLPFKKCTDCHQKKS